MPAPRLIVCERTSRWATAWRRAAGGVELPLVEARSMTHCEAALADSPASVAAVDADFLGGERLAQALARWRDRFPLARLFVLASPDWRTSDLALREAGAAEVICSPPALVRAVRMLQRHRRLPETIALADRAADDRLEDQVLGRLPWARYAAAEVG